MEIRFDSVLLIMNNLIPIIVAFEEGGKFVRCHISADDFERWRNEPECWYYDTVLHTTFGKIHATVPIIWTMPGFIYDKIITRHGYPLLREYKSFPFDINNIPKL